MKIKKSIYGETIIYAFFKTFFTPSLRPAFFKCVKSIFYNFFFRQFRASFLPGRIPVSQVDHQIDEKIPFVPRWVTIYLDFIYFWIRILTFFLARYKRKAYIPIRDFIFSIGGLYAYAAEVYSKNLSTTKRPFYISRPRFLLIHLADPHLMCIPSLHVMVAVHTYTMFRVIAKKIGEDENLKEQILEMRLGALAICQAILFVKQHSVNCIPAALYAMTCFNPEIFTVGEAVAFTEQLFSHPPAANEETAKYATHPCAAPLTVIPETDQKHIKSHILSLYYRFLEERKTAKTWIEPLLKFLKTIQ